MRKSKCYRVVWVSAGATVTVSCTGFDKQTGQNVTETKSGVTGSGGSVRLVTVVDSSASLCVTSVTHATLAYDAAQNVVTCVFW